MDFDAGAAVFAGPIAGAIMIVPIYMGLVRMPLRKISPGSRLVAAI
ncbi:MAG: hypothetical protein IH961_08675 [Chloroflexi bacterium]|nr:hypothetical protein [Chloroflexota bacterium]